MRGGLPRRFLLFSGRIRLLFVPVVTFWQRDMKTLVSYRRVVHMGVFSVRFFVMRCGACFGRFLIQVRHGFVSSMLFFLVGRMSHIRGRRLIYFNNSGYYFLFLLGCMFNGGFPLRLCFLGELLFFCALYSFGISGVLLVGWLVLGRCYYNLYLFVGVLRKVRVGGGGVLLFLFVLVNLFIIY